MAQTSEELEFLVKLLTLNSAYEKLGLLETHDIILGIALKWNLGKREYDS